MGQYALCMGVNDYSQFVAENPGWHADPLPYSSKNAQDFAHLLSIDSGQGIDGAARGQGYDAPYCLRLVGEGGLQGRAALVELGSGDGGSIAARSVFGPPVPGIPCPRPVAAPRGAAR